MAGVPKQPASQYLDHLDIMEIMEEAGAVTGD
jgi:hypothetical protein